MNRNGDERAKTGMKEQRIDESAKNGDEDDSLLVTVPKGFQIQG